MGELFLYFYFFSLVFLLLSFITNNLSFVVKDNDKRLPDLILIQKRMRLHLSISVVIILIGIFSLTLASYLCIVLLSYFLLVVLVNWFLRMRIRTAQKAFLKGLRKLTSEEFTRDSLIEYFNTETFFQKNGEVFFENFSWVRSKQLVLSSAIIELIEELAELSHTDEKNWIP